LLIDLEEKTNNRYFLHNKEEHNDKPVMGMFGTGFGGFAKSSSEDVKTLIEMFIKINDCFDEVECLNIVKKTLITEMFGIKNGVLTTILHCLKPTFFPIMNNHNSKDSVYSRLGIAITNQSNLTEYTDNVLNIKAFRDNHFKFKNYN
jgi:hypothetical protein